MQKREKPTPSWVHAFELQSFAGSMGCSRMYSAIRMGWADPSSPGLRLADGCIWVLLCLRHSSLPLPFINNSQSLKTLKH